MKPHAAARRDGFGLIELLVILATLAVFAALILPRLARTHCRQKRPLCSSNLKQVALAWRIWANDQNDRFPWQVPHSEGGTLEFASSSQVFRHFQVASNELVTPKILVCPEDKERQRGLDFSGLEYKNISYFAGVNAIQELPNAWLAGDRNLSGAASGRIFTLATNSSGLHWMPTIHTYQREKVLVGTGNIALADGSAQSMDNRHLRQALAQTQLPVVRLAIP